MIGKLKLKYIFYFFAVIGIILFFSFAFVENDGQSFEWLVMENSSSLQFSDYFRIVGYARRHGSIYEQNADYPPLAYLPAYFLWRINPYAGEMKVWTDFPLVMDTPYNLLIFLMYSIVSCLLFLYSIQRFQDHRGQESFFLTLILIFSLPFFSAAIERGNLVLLVLDLMILALAIRDSNNACLRELALILIAIAAGCKLYPAALGLLYLKEKRFKEASRLVIYGLALFFLPFIFFGGITGLQTLISNSRAFSFTTHFRWASIFGLICDLAYRFGGWEGLQNAILPASLAGSLMLVLLTLLSLRTKEKWRCQLFLAGMFSVSISSGFRYGFIFFVIPLLFILRDYGEKTLHGNVSKLIPFFLFSQIFTIPALFLMLPALSSIYVEKVSSVFVYLLLFWGVAEEIRDLTKKSAISLSSN